MELQQKVIQAFQVEHKDQVEGIRSILSMLDPTQTAPDDPQLEEAFRMAHSLKGGARVCDFRDVETLAHRMESLFAGVRENSVEFNDAVTKTIFRALDVIEDWMAAYTTGEVPPSSVDSLQAIDRCLRTMKVQETAESTAPKENSDAQPRTNARPLAHSTSAATRELETLRVQTRHFNAVLRSADSLCVLNDENEHLAREFDHLSHELHALQHECEAMHATTGHIARSTTLTSEAAGVVRYAEVITQLAHRIIKQQRHVQATHHRLSWALRTRSDELRSQVQKTRMIAADDVLQGLRPMVRNLARDENKEIEFRAIGLDIRADRMVLQALKDPLIHILRNAVVHGMEKRDERTQQGKDVVGQIQLELQNKGNRLHIRVEDDGRGIDPDRVAHQAHQQGLPSAASLDWQSDADELNEVLFHPGFSTLSGVNELAGRGMGLSVVRDTLTKLRGTVRIGPGPDCGTVLEISVPLFISAERMLLVSSANQFFGVPIGAIDHLLRLHASDVQEFGGRSVAIVDDEPIPLVELSQAIGCPTAPSSAKTDSLAVVVLASASRRVGVIVDAFATEREALIKALDAPASNVKAFSGAIILEDNDVALTLDPTYLLASVSVKKASTEIGSPTSEKRLPMALVVDDSFTTRTLEKSILETNGYDVRIAVDGVEALAILESEEIDIVITDIEMPRMNGIALLRAIRQDPRFVSLPVILVTSLDRSEDREHGMKVGANAYIVKRKFDHQELLDTIRRFL